MKVVVLIKTATGGAVDAEDAFTRAARTAPGVIGPADAHALEEAIRLRENGLAHEAVCIALAPSSEVLGALREALAMGIDRAVLIADPAMEGADLLARSALVAAALSSEPADLYLNCTWSGDVDGTLLWAAVAERLGHPVMTQARHLSLAAESVTIERQVETGNVTLKADLPCLVEVTDTINKPRRASMKGRTAARAKPLAVLSLADLEAAPAKNGTRIVALQSTPPTRTPTLLEGPAATAENLVSFLETHGFLA